MAGIVTLQGKIAVTGTPQQLASAPGQYKSFTLGAKSTNTAAIGVTVSNTAGSGATDGTGTGFILEKGITIPLVGLNDINTLWVTGTANDIYSLIAVS